MRRKITIPLTTTISAHAAQDLIFGQTEVENVATRLGGDVKIISASLISRGNKCPSIDLVFSENGHEALAGETIGSPLSFIGTANLRTILFNSRICGIVTLDEVTDGNTGALPGNYISTKSNIDLIVSTGTNKSNDLSTSFHVFGIAKSDVTTSQTSDFTLILDIE